jgi:hypothetical protein
VHFKKDEGNVKLQEVFFKLIDLHNAIVGESDKACYIFETQFNIAKILSFAAAFTAHAVQRVSQKEFMERLDVSTELIDHREQ